jgi:hypothetical protein
MRGIRMRNVVPEPGEDDGGGLAKTGGNGNQTGFAGCS